MVLFCSNPQNTYINRQAALKRNLSKKRMSFKAGFSTVSDASYLKIKNSLNQSSERKRLDDVENFLKKYEQKFSEIVKKEQDKISIESDRNLLPTVGLDIKNNPLTGVFHILVQNKPSEEAQSIKLFKNNIPKEVKVLFNQQHVEERKMFYPLKNAIKNKTEEGNTYINLLRKLPDFDKIKKTLPYHLL